jgi:putative ABC transport system permease protein
MATSANSMEVIMFKNCLKIAFRNIKKYKVYSFINIAGLAMGIALFVMIMLFVRSELSYDQFNLYKNRVYRIELEDSAVMPPAVGKAITDHFPEVEECVRLEPRQNYIIKTDDKKIKVKDFLWAENGVFEVFTFRFIQGNPKMAFSDPFSLVLTRRTSRKVFGSSNPLGKVVTILSPYVKEKFSFRITGVIDDPDKFHIPVDAIANLSLLLKARGQEYNKVIDDSWMHPTYIKLPKNYNKKHFEQKLDAFFKTHYQFKRPDTQLVALNGLYFHRGGKLGEHYRKIGNLGFLYIYTAIGILILFIAAVNFINLSTARGGLRSQEIAIKKVIGADRRSLILQFLSESIVMVCIAFVFAIVLAEVFLQEFNRLINGNLSLEVLKEPLILFFTISGVIGLGILAGLYPAVYLSSFQPAPVLKGEKTTGHSGLKFRKILFILQFTISIILIISTLMVRSQLKFMRHRDLGFQEEQVITLQLNSNIFEKREVFREKLLASPHISAVSYSCRVPGDNWWNWTVGIKDKRKSIRVNAIDPEYLDLLDIEVASGRNFSWDLATDRGQKFILNETAVRLFNLGPEEAVGEMVEESANGRGVIIGVVKDFHFYSLHKFIEPLLFYWDERAFGHISIKIATTDIASAVAHVKKSWKNLSPEFPCEYSFLDESFDRQYKNDERLFKYFKYFSFIAIIISSLGLLGLVSFMVVQRQKEVGIRKILGASVSSITISLSRDFIKWILVSNLMAWPLAYYIINKWLQNFAYRTDIAIGTFILSALLALIIAIFTLSYQSIRAATANPVEVLRNN